VSPRAACRLESIGFGRVYDYTAGKADWGSFGLPLEGQRPSSTRVGAYTRADVPTCAPTDRLREVCDRVEAAGWDTCFVVNAQRVVLGRLGRSGLSGRKEVTAEEAMSAGPSTIRPSIELDKAAVRMQTQNLTGLPVTCSDGVLLGLLWREDAEARTRRDVSANRVKCLMCTRPSRLSTIADSGRGARHRA
jgi:CBS domain-containing protein